MLLQHLQLGYRFVGNTFVLQPTARLPLWIDQQWPSSSGHGGGRYRTLHRRLIAREPL